MLFITAKDDNIFYKENNNNKSRMSSATILLSTLRVKILLFLFFTCSDKLFPNDLVASPSKYDISVGLA